MSDAICLVRSDSHGTVMAGGQSFHFIWWSLDGLISVQQLHDGGRFPDADCGVACLQGIFLKRLHMSVNGLTIEHDAGTSGAGTAETGLLQAAADFGISGSIERGFPAEGSFMNPATGAIHGPEVWMQYRAASAGSFVWLPGGPTTVDNPQPTGGIPLPHTEDEMAVVTGRLCPLPDPTSARIDEFQLDRAGTVWHKFSDGSTAWGSEQIGPDGQTNSGVSTGLDPMQGLACWRDTNGQINVEGVRPDGRVWHGWQAKGGTKFATEVKP